MLRRNELHGAVGTHFSKSQYISLRQVPVYNLYISQIPRSTFTIVTIVSAVLVHLNYRGVVSFQTMLLT